MKLKRLVLFGLLISTGIINAQKDFKPGYIIKTTGDTIYGHIDFQGDLLMSSICRFKDKESVTKVYYPNDIAAFRFIDGKYYISRTVNNKKVFLEYLIKGKINIYYMRDDIGGHYYIDKEDAKFAELPYSEGIKYVDDKKVFFKTKSHIGFLNYYMQDVPELKIRIASVEKPQHHNLIKLAEAYHYAVCKDQKCIIYEKKMPLLKMAISPFVGLTNYKGYGKFRSELGVYLYFCDPSTNEKLFFKTGLTHIKLSEDSKSLNVYKIPLQLQYRYRANRIQPNISAGVNFFIGKLDDYRMRTHTLSLNVGLDYKISDKTSLCTAFNSEFTPISALILAEEYKFDIISYSIIIGLRIDL
jgi:hypothetical protein